MNSWPAHRGSSTLRSARLTRDERSLAREPCSQKRGNECGARAHPERGGWGGRADRQGDAREDVWEVHDVQRRADAMVIPGSYFCFMANLETSDFELSGWNTSTQTAICGIFVHLRLHPSYGYIAVAPDCVKYECKPPSQPAGYLRPGYLSRVNKRPLSYLCYASAVDDKFKTRKGDRNRASFGEKSRTLRSNAKRDEGTGVMNVLF